MLNQTSIEIFACIGLLSTFYVICRMMEALIYTIIQARKQKEKENNP